MTVSNQLLKGLLSSLAIILVSLLMAQAQPAAPSPSSSPAASPSSSPQAKSAGGKTNDAEVVVPPEKAQPVRIPRFEKPPVIDGKLDDEVWKSAVVLKDFYQTNPGDNIAPSKATEAFIGYDSKFLYFGFHAYDDPGKVRATMAQRDNVFGEDNIRLFLDTFNDQRKAYVLGFNPLGVQQDGILTEGSGTDFSVDVVMEGTYGLVGPKGMDTTVAATLHDAFKAAMDQPGFAAAIANFHQEARYLGRSEFRAFALDQIEKQRRIVEELGLRLN